MIETRIELTDTIIDIVSKMSEGNPGAMNALMNIITPNNIDPDNSMGGLGVILSLDTHGIYGTDIYVLYSDICDKNLVNMLAVMRSVQLGLFDASILKDACSRQDYSGKELVPVEELYEKVKKKLPNFNDQEDK